MKNILSKLGVTCGLLIALGVSVSSVALAEEGDLYSINSTSGPSFEVRKTEAERVEAVRKGEVLSSDDYVKTPSKEEKVAEKVKKPVDPTKLPVYVYGEHIVYHEETGDFTAEQNVRIRQGQQILVTDKAYGNVQTGDIYFDQGGTLREGPTTTHGQKAHYNFLQRNGRIDTIKGTSSADKFTAPYALIYPDRMLMPEGGTSTRCTAVKRPKCVEVRAKKVVIYPERKLVATDVKGYIQGKHVYSRDKYVKELNKKAGPSYLPSIGYSTEKGWEFTYTYRYDFSAKDRAYADLQYYTKKGWKPLYGFNHDERNFSIKYKYGFEEDSNNNWIKKQNDFYLYYKPHYFTKHLPLRYSLFLEHGLWKDDRKSSWHTEYGAYISHDRINFGEHKRPLFLDLTIGKKWTKESYSGIKYNTDIITATMGRNMGSNWNTWLKYSYQKTENNLFAYNMPDMERELQFGLSKSFDRRNYASVVARYDAGKHNPYEYILRYTHRFCCWALSFEYKIKKYGDKNNEFRVRYELLNW